MNADFVRQALTIAVMGMVLSLTGCATMMKGGGGSEGRFLRAGEPIGPLPGYEAGPVLSVDDAVAAPAGVPAGFTARQGIEPLEDGYVPGIGPIEALVLSMSLGNQQPSFTESDIEASVFGVNERERGTAANELFRASRGALRFHATVLPTLIDPAIGDARQMSAGAFGQMARDALLHWSSRVDLRQYDNDGPDGIPGSRDDDGKIDMLFMAVESDSRFASLTLAGDFSVRTPAGKIAIAKIHLLSVPRSERLRPDEALGLVFDALGVDHGERYFPKELGRTVSSIARARLGWIPVKGLVRTSGNFALENEVAITIPLRDLDGGAGFWLLERADEKVFAVQAARKGDGHYHVIETREVEYGGEQLLALNRQLGPRGPSAFLRWEQREGDPMVELMTEGPGAGWALRELREEKEPGPSLVDAGEISGARNLVRAASFKVDEEGLRPVAETGDSVGTEGSSSSRLGSELGPAEVIDGLLLLGSPKGVESGMPPALLAAV